MARARAIETRLEKLVPALDEYYSSGFLTREETVEVSRQRQHWEFRLVAKPLLLLDVRGAITYELGLESRLREYCIHTKLNLQHRWDIVDRIESIYKIGLKHLRNRAEHEVLRQECVAFLKQFQRNGSLSNLYGEMMVMHPRRSDIWVEAAEWQNSALRNTDNARAILQQALLTMASEPAVWACALRVELQFVQRLLDGLLVDHREEARKARTPASVADADADLEGAEAAEPTAVIATKLRAENEALAHVLLDLAVAKTVVEEAFEGPASGAALLGQLLAVAGGFPFSREVMELAVRTATQKMAAACAGPSDATVAASSSAPSSSSPAAALTIASDQQRLRVRTQWRHRQSIDAVLAHALALDDALVNGYATAIVDTATYLADGGDEALPRRGPKQRSPHTSASFKAPSLEERRRAAVASVVSLLTFAAVPTATLATALPGVVAADMDSTKRFPEVRRAFAAAMQRLADASREGASLVCAHLLHALPAATTAAAPAPRPSPSAKNGKQPPARQHATTAAAAPMDMATVAQRLLRVSRLDTDTATACITAPQERAAALVEELVAAAAMQPPPRTRARHDAAAAGESAGPVMTWSAAQLERFLLSEDRDALLRGHNAGAATASTLSATPSAAAAGSPAVSHMTAEDVVRFVVWWKEEEAQLRAQQQQQQGDASDRDASASASQARRRAAVVELLAKHGLLPASAAQTSSAPSSAAAKKKTKGRTAGDGAAEAWAKAEALLLTRSTALQHASANAPSAATRLPLTLWRVFSTLETMEGTAARDVAGNSGPNRDGDSDSDDEQGAEPPATHRASGVRFASYAAAGLFYLSGVPHSTLSREEEWVRLEGVTSLLRCRLASWLGRVECTRDVVVGALRRAPSAAAAEDWLADVHGLLSMAQRCQPLPRVAQTRCVLPFLEGVALYRTASSLPSAKAARDAVQAAREAHEMLLKLYGVSPHPEAFLPLTYDGTPSKALAQDSAVVGKASTAAVQESNAEDWVAYILFERAVSKDLLKAKTVVEQARGAALAPQLFMVRLNAL